MISLNLIRWLIIFAVILESTSGISFILPGTKWCGPGNVSTNYHDLGPLKASDKCCREHDFCPNSIPPNSTKHGLVNNHPLARSFCDCDEKFRKCLKRVKSTYLDIKAAKLLGYIYFTLMEAHCYEKVQRSFTKRNSTGRKSADEYRWRKLPPF